MTHPSTQTSPPRVLLLTYACAPDRGSEGGVGWHRAVESAKRYDTWVISVDNFYADSIRRHLADHGDIPGLHFVFVPTSRWQRLLSRVPGGRYFAYNLWHRQALRTAQELHRQHQFDLVHQVTFCGYREPGYLWKLDAPFLWGPIGGTQNYPWQFLTQAGPWGALVESLRTVGNYLQLRFSRRVRAAARRASVLLCANSTNRRDFARAHNVDPVLMLETGISSLAAAPRRRDPQRREFRILWSGQFKPGKCLPLLLRAIAQLPADVSWRLRLLGEGTRERAWRRMARRLQLADRIEWLGWLPHSEAIEQYSWADVLVFTSLRDTSGNVVLESLSAALPVICLDHQGVHDIVTNECGVKVPVTTPRDVACRLRDAIAILCKDADRWERCSAAALGRATEYSWSRQGERMAAVYRQVLAAGKPSPPAKAPYAPPKSRGANWQHRAVGWAAACLARSSNFADNQSFAIFNYHRVSPLVPGIPAPTINVTPERFRSQLLGLQDRGYVIRPLAEMLRRRRLGLPAPERTVVLTFDDGFASVYTQAWPILKELRAPATILVCTAFLNGEAPFPFDPWGHAFRDRVPAECWRPLRTDECREMLDSGLIEFGAHTHTHQDFRARPADFRDDLAISVRAMREQFGLDEVGFAFPFGYNNDAMMDVARQVGVSCALTVKAALVDPQSDPFGWGRFTVYSWDTASELAARRQGWYSWVLQQYARWQQMARRSPRPATQEGA
jgi:glycosyltransferase involved in cell wall biosynthesis/peptidoglycan/xylan/chitin deacetylase (PgdA/CDA1 family)